MAEMLSPGVQFTEPRTAPNDVPSASTAVGLMLGIAERGPINDAQLIGDFGTYVRIFGNYYLGSPLPGSVKGFFDNGGKSLWVTRVGHYTTITDATTLDAVKAIYQLQGDGPANTALISASSHGQHGNALSVTTARVNTLIAKTTALLAASAQLSAPLDDVRRVYVGAQLLLADAGTPSQHARVVVTRVDSAQKLVYFISTTPTGAIASGGTVTLEESDISILREGSFIERISRLAMSTLAGELYFKDKINNKDPVRQIEVTTDSALAATNAVDPRPLVVTSQPLTTGSDGTTPNDVDHVGSSASATGLYSFDVISQGNLLAIPGRPTLAVHNGIITYAEARKTLFAILAVNKGQTPIQALTYVQTTANLFSEYAAVYYPWIKIADATTGQLVDHTPEGMIMGDYARTDATRGVQKAPAGTPDGRLINALGPERVLTQTDRDLLYPANINPIIAPTGQGTITYGSRTLSSGDFRQINVRRVFLFFKLSLDAGTAWVVFEENNSQTRGKVRKTVAAFCLRQWRKGVLMGDKASNAFIVQCDEDNNPPSVINAGQLVCSVSLAVSRPAEFVTFELRQDTRSADAELAAAGL